MKAFEQLVTEQRDEVLLGYNPLSDHFSDEILCHVDRQVWGPVLDRVEQIAQFLDEALNV